MPSKSENCIQQTWNQQFLALSYLIVLRSLVAYFVPYLPNSSSGILNGVNTVGFHQIVALTLTSALIVIYPAYYRAQAYFSTRWLIAALTYNGLILFVKFTL